MYRYKENETKNSLVLSHLSDEELISETVQTMWSVHRAKDQKPLLPRLQTCHDEMIERKKPYLWNKAKDCFAEYRKKEF